MGEVHIKRDRSVPAAIQFKNPGAMWPGAIATKWGSTKWQYLADGTGQGGGGKGNKIAIFDDWDDGIAAQMDLWRSSKNYRNKTLADAIRVWSGGNNVPSYLAYLKARVPGLTNDTVMDDDFWNGSMAIPFLRAQAAHEAGKPIPASAADYVAAQHRVMGDIEPTPAKLALTTKWLQESLNELGAHIEVTGQPDKATRDAIRDFQQAMKLDVDGLVGPATLKALHKALEAGKVIIIAHAEPDDSPSLWGRIWDLFKSKG